MFQGFQKTAAFIHAKGSAAHATGDETFVAGMPQQNAGDLERLGARTAAEAA
jgi:hypothetical protein